MSGRLLAISWATLPLSAPRAMQVCRLLAHLPSQGWESEIVTSSECSDTPPSVAEHALAGLYDRHYTRHEVEAREDRAASSWLRRAWQRWQSPSTVHNANWVRRATAQAVRRLESRRFDALITFAQPWTDHLIGLRLKRRCPDLPWLAHFSDPWVDNPYYAKATRRGRASVAAQERAVIEAADCVVFVTKQTADLVMAKYPPAWRDKVRVIPHGFDAAILEQIESPPADGRQLPCGQQMRIVHTGSLYHGARPVSGLLEALSSLQRGSKDAAIALDFIGYNPPAFEEEIRQWGLKENFLMSEPRSWLESVRAAAAADVLLVIDAPAANSVFLPSKLVEYLVLRKPILGLTPECGASSDLLRRLGYAIAPPQDPTAIAKRLQQLLAEWQGGRLSVSAQHDHVAAEYDARHIAERVAMLLSEMSGIARSTAGPARDPALSKAVADPKGKCRPSSERIDGLQAAIDSAARSLHEDQFLIVTPHALSATEIAELLDNPRIDGLVVGRGSEVDSSGLGGRVGNIDMEAGTWSLPRTVACRVVFLDHPNNFGVRRSLSAIKLGLDSVTFPATYMTAWDQHSAIGLLCRSAFNALRRRGPGLIPPAWRRASFAGLEWRLERSIRRSLARPPLLLAKDFISKRVLLLNSSLGPGGTERQVVNTAVGLLGRGVRDLSVLCDRLTPGSGDFHATTLRDLDVSTSERSRVMVGDLAGSLQAHASQLAQRVRRLPIDLSVDLVAYVAEFLVRRPAVVHAWQDETSVKAGLAAAIVGVPRIVLSGRSVAPHHFLFHQPYMRSCYRALSQLPNVVMINNSHTGAQDYERWLGLEHGRIRVVQNGFDFASLRRPDLSRVMAYRAKHGIASDCPVVGTIIRFSEEKRPLLWLEIAACLARQRNDLAFLMIGDGILKPEVIAAVEALGLRERIVLAGIEQNAALALASMDVFLLTSRKEGLPNVLVEAQMLGVPVVSTDAGGARETFEDGATGRLVKSDDPARIAAAVLSMLDDVTWRNRAIASAPDYVRQRFSLDRMVDDTLNVYGFTE